MSDWQDHLEKKLIHVYGEKDAQALCKKYNHAFPAGFREDYDPEAAINDIKMLEQLSADNRLAVQFYKHSPEETNRVHLKLFQWEHSIPLSDVLPMLENFNLRTEEERPYKITCEKNTVLWVNDFSLQLSETLQSLESMQLLFTDAFSRVYFGLAENDGFNKLVISAALDWQEVNILRAYAKYLHQIRFPYSQGSIERALLKHISLTQDLVVYFKCLHDPKQTPAAAQKTGQLEKQILEKLELIPELDEDTIIRRILILIQATLRTNYFQRGADGVPARYLSFKLHSRVIPDLPLPMPLYETFVYSSQFEGIHLRYDKVARGGLRWSDRREDYRTEVLGLMKAQVVKNSVIVPSGAKGGFILKQVPNGANRERIQQEVTDCYTLFIRGLLDLADNVKQGVLIPPKHVLCHDEHDSYLVVAADKGTATFSDLANSIAKEYDFWLGDAFASGGSAGYDHKKMGITARGAWESAKRHFRELDINIETSEFTVVGVGDMSGDVFGNGMLYSQNIRLIAAFDHRHIFIDPDPESKASYQERQRLFNLPSSSWEDYDARLISKGGGVFKRSLKSIPISPEIKKALDIQKDSLSPLELIQAILKAPVDLLFNGGVGTYVKSAQESHADVGDRANERCRVNGHELRCKIVCEGGNLGLTQLGRVEFALHGGLLNTDFIDNSAGVDCSDHEVNLKILLNEEMQQGNLSLEKRDEVLVSLTSEISDLVLENNYQQALVLSYAAFMAKEDIGLHAEYIKELESKNILNRAVEYLPENKALMERKAGALGLTRPELATLLAYTKINLKEDILHSRLPEDAFLAKKLGTAFPGVINKTYHDALEKHQLKRDIIATQLANAVINNMGLTFIYKTQMETGASVEDIIKAYTVASEIFSSHALQRLIESLDYKVSMSKQLDMIINIRKLLALSTRWFLQNNRINDQLQPLIECYSQAVTSLEQWIPDLMGGATKEYLTELGNEFQKAGLSKDVASRIATYRAIYASLNIIEVAMQNEWELEATARIYFASGERLNLLWFRDQIANDPRESFWNQLAQLSLRDELDLAQRTLTIRIMQKTSPEESAEKRVSAWVDAHQTMMVRWDKLLAMVHESTTIEYSTFFIVIGEFIRLLQHASPDQ
ncbi:MAG: NAD-glutamate dehydrogenase [Legionellaceae bacterium]|nr:NAD-glutamate dehydrogenase [Legionellaceae bacterium]